MILISIKLFFSKYFYQNRKRKQNIHKHKIVLLNINYFDFIRKMVELIKTIIDDKTYDVTIIIGRDT